MNWEIVAQLGCSDNWSPSLAKTQARLLVKLNCKSHAQNLDIEQLLSRSGIVLSEIYEDLMNIAATIYSIDLRIPRQYSEDTWTRSLRVHQPVRDLDRWRNAGPILTKALNFLTGDDWHFEFRQSSYKRSSKGETVELEDVDSICLFSGGLDSLIGAVDCVLKSKSKVALVGHYGAGMTGSVQTKILAGLEKAFPEKFHPIRFYVQPSKKSDDGEQSMRSRSFLFFTLGTIVREHLKCASPLTVAENGLISLNIPLTLSRVGSLSTRTTHPYFIKCYSELLETLGLGMQIKTPYKFQTKGEMIIKSPGFDVLKTLILDTQSCSHPEVGRYMGMKPGVHCGYCVPCIIRRASLRKAKIRNEHYLIDILTNRPAISSDRSDDVTAFTLAIERFKMEDSNAHIRQVLGTGPIPKSDILEYAKLYQRGMMEIGDFLST